MPTKFQLLTIAAAIGVTGLIAACAWLWRRKSQVELKAKIDQKTEKESESLQLDAETPPEANPQVESTMCYGTADLDELTTQIIDPVLRDYLVEIANTVSEAGPVFDSETPLSFIEEMVDRLDDLSAIQTNHQELTTSVLESFRAILIGLLSECGAELIHSTHWDPAQQRAITKEPTSGLDAPTILRHGSTGIRRNGQLLRKQEVVLAVPEPI
jgi:hypothetical protein